MRALALLGLLSIAACSLEKGGLGAGPDDDANSPPVSSGDDAPPVTGDDDATTIDVSVPAPDAPVGFPPEAGGDAPTGSDASEAATPPQDASDAAELDASDATAHEAGEAGEEAGDASEAGHKDAMPDVGGGPDAPPTCVSTIPRGWAVAIYDLGPDVCPTGFVEHDVQGPPTVGAGACSCSCAVTQDGSCTQGTLSTFGDTLNANACGNAWFTVPITADSVCTTIPPQVPPTRPVPLSFEADPLPGVGGTCAGTVVPDPTQVATNAARYCDVPTGSAEAVCNGTVPSGFAACISHPGTVACPAGTPFVHAFPVEDSAGLQCAACTACSVSTSCTNAVVTIHTGARCNDTGVDLTVDGTCNPTNFAGAKAANTVEYTATESSSCSSGTSVASATLTNPVTVCCL